MQSNSDARDLLLAAAIALFARKGYHATSVREIVEAAGVTKPVLYYWFGSKEGLFHALVELAVAAHREVLASVRASGGTATERILLLGERVIELVCAHADVVRVFDAVYYGPREGAPAVDFDPLYGEFNRFLRDLVVDGVRTGEFRDGDVVPMHAALLGAFLVCDTAAVAAAEHAPPPCAGALATQDVRQVLTIVLDGMRAGEGGA
ncbi:MAG TPA: TetR/AcrR family transcriptional regulator [Candidatus Krumholzibacteria bacterium]|nr:TetR/AcrR family transcriptional regulator [Candidatus Krumholzibacteria bacterium]HPD73221.1 TetR/AcrR family transcriptional regulator [Candidatus Krumholzibacteria bacterium]HRY40183.1 TetR/AcrR family transcriptional regulator [Candidatus Krumholzibacteria bacterium]